jgi:translation initiation factor 2A
VFFLTQTLDKEGPIHDVSWSPNSKEFAVVYGYMPAKTTIFNTKAEPTYNFPLAPRNTIVFSPHGRFVLVAGFGNLAGQVDMYDLSKNYAKVCTIEASNASICEWSPDGSHILFATTSPRLRVDNGIRVFHVGGGLMYYEEMTELYHVCWRPQSTTMHPLPADPLNPVPTPHPSALAVLAKAKPATKPAGAYRPPGARGTTTPLHFKREDEGGTAFASNGLSNISNVNGFGKSRRREVPGAETVDNSLPPGAAPGGGVSLAGTGEGADEGLSKAALKNKKKREAKKAKEAADREKGLAAEGNGVEGAPKGPRAMSASPERRGFHQRNRSGYEHAHGRSPQRPNRNMQNQRSGNNGDRVNGDPGSFKVSAPPPNVLTDSKEATPDLTVTSPGGTGSPQEKKVRSLLKKLRAIEDLKMRQAGGEKLEDTQIRKIRTEESVRNELESMGGLG